MKTRSLLTAAFVPALIACSATCLPLQAHAEEETANVADDAQAIVNTPSNDVVNATSENPTSNEVSDSNTENASKPAMQVSSISSSINLNTANSTTAKAGNCDKIIGLGKNVKIIATVDTTNSKNKAIYKSASTSSKIIYKIQGRSCLVCDTSDMVKGKHYSMVKVLLPGTSAKYGYIRVSQFKFGKIDTSNYGFEKTTGTNAKRITACNYALTFLGSHYSNANSTVKSKGLNCRQLLEKSYDKAGIHMRAGRAYKMNNDKYGKKVTRENLKPGDIVFYKGAHGGKNFNHVAMYLGNGYIIQSTCDKGRNYPRGGVHISKLVFRSSPQGYRNPFKD